MSSGLIPSTSGCRRSGKCCVQSPVWNSIRQPNRTLPLAHQPWKRERPPASPVSPPSPFFVAMLISILLVEYGSLQDVENRNPQSRLCRYDLCRARRSIRIPLSDPRLSCSETPHQFVSTTRMKPAWVTATIGDFVASSSKKGDLPSNPRCQIAEMAPLPGAVELG